MQTAVHGRQPACAGSSMHSLSLHSRMLRLPRIARTLTHRLPLMRTKVAELGTEASTAANDRANAGKSMGEIHIIIGPMFSGKSTRLLQRVREAEASGQRVVLVKSAVDTRYSVDHVVTHNGDKRPCVSLSQLRSLRERLGTAEYDKVDVVAVDEAQFIEDLAESVVDAAEADGKVVLVAGLSGDSQRQRFGQLLDLVPLADRVDKVEGRCSFCDQPSLFTLRISASTQQQLVGGAESYAPVCRRHYRELHAVRAKAGGYLQEAEAGVA